MWAYTVTMDVRIRPLISYEIIDGRGAIVNVDLAGALIRCQEKGTCTGLQGEAELIRRERKRLSRPFTEGQGPSVINDGDLRRDGVEKRTRVGEERERERRRATEVREPERAYSRPYEMMNRTGTRASAYDREHYPYRCSTLLAYVNTALQISVRLVVLSRSQRYNQAETSAMAKDTLDTGAVKRRVLGNGAGQLGNAAIETTLVLTDAVTGALEACGYGEEWELHGIPHEKWIWLDSPHRAKNKDIEKLQADVEAKEAPTSEQNHLTRTGKWGRGAGLNAATKRN
ncbi:hypothetical protein FISHEDRAFT_57856 [Fistulina hepatica ATCC 64428]|uniref:Uncharacterized protein n=1 Tax=Fistulina hepatica ATCC 64428 TaxID=1128425 RepID=A0A0D7AGJ4_9AGAR|nr:hypothetical protein FISHEDRAFT_57856 [Fistulina hepatica ATCC 64428]